MFLEALWRPSSVRDSSGGLGDQHMNNTLLSTYIYTYISIFICVRMCMCIYIPKLQHWHMYHITHIVCNC